MLPTSHPDSQLPRHPAPLPIALFPAPPVTSIASTPSPPFIPQPTPSSCFLPASPLGLARSPGPPNGLFAPCSTPLSAACWAHTLPPTCTGGPWDPPLLGILSSLVGSHRPSWAPPLCPPLHSPASIFFRSLFAAHTTCSSPWAPDAICPCPGLCSELKLAPDARCSPLGKVTGPGPPPTLRGPRLPHLPQLHGASLFPHDWCGCISLSLFWKPFFKKASSL